MRAAKQTRRACCKADTQRVIAKQLLTNKHTHIQSVCFKQTKAKLSK